MGRNRERQISEEKPKGGGTKRQKYASVRHFLVFKCLMEFLKSALQRFSLFACRKAGVNYVF